MARRDLARCPARGDAGCYLVVSNEHSSPSGWTLLLPACLLLRSRLGFVSYREYARTIRVSFWPPKPKLLDRAMRTGTRRDSLGT